MKSIYQFLPLILLSILTMVTEGISAQAKDGEYTVTQGNTVTVSISSAYANTLKKATGISATWSAGSSAISIQSRTNSTCTIKGVSVASPARLNYYCSYYIDGYYRTMNFYYEITVKSNVIYVTNVQISPSNATMNIGETLNVTATAYPTNATNRSLNWSTENYSIASVNSNGVVTARGAGKVWIWARAQDGSGAGNYCVVTVNEPTKVTSIELDVTEQIMNIGDEISLIANVLPNDAYNKDLLWSSNNTDVALVSNGVVTAVGAGSCDVICSSTDGSNVSATCSIIVNEPEQYWLSVILPNGMFAINATDIEPVKIKITPDTNFEIHSITLNGIEQSYERDETKLTLSKLEENATLNVVFAMIEATNNINSISNDAQDIRLLINKNVVSVTGLPLGETINVYNQNGMLLKTTQDSSFILEQSGVYIVRIGTKVYKLSI